MTSPLLWTLFLASTLTPSQSRGDAEKRVLTVEDYFRNAELDDPQLSPDGTWIAYTVTTNDLEADKSTTRIWMVPSDGSDEAVPMTAESSSASAPRFSPDGKYLAFLAARGDQKTQVWALFRHGGEAQPITTVDQGVSSYAWSPDGDRLALVVKDPDPNQEDTPKDAQTVGHQPTSIQARLRGLPRPAPDAHLYLRRSDERAHPSDIRRLR